MNNKKNDGTQIISDFLHIYIENNILCILKYKYLNI